jgi:hypothetical protein
MPATRPEAEPAETGLEDRFVKWIPLVVPLAALFLAAVVALIELVVL